MGRVLPPQFLIKGEKMKIFVLSLMLTLPFLLFCATRTVALDGSQQYTSIQSAVNNSRHGDVVLVYPGRYEENIEFIAYNISLLSLYTTNPQHQYIENTIIDGNLASCIRVVNGETISINGFTLVNNEDGGYIVPNYAGGGIYIKNSSMGIVTNCIIRNCFALAGGGISVTGNSSLSISNVQIFDNIALGQGGGLSFQLANELNVDTVHPCSIYNNYAAQGMDFSIFFTRYNATPYALNLDMGSIAMSEPDGYFVNVRFAVLSVNIARSYIDPIDHDLYVSPNGNDANTGLAVETPLKTIAYAMQKMASNPHNPRTLYLSEGVYSHSANGQLFPFAIKSHVRVQGAGSNSTVFDGEYNRTFWGCHQADNVEVSGIKMINARSVYLHPTSVYFCNDFSIHDVVFLDSAAALSSGIAFGYSTGITIENLREAFTIFNNDIAAIWTFNCDNVMINNAIVHDNIITDNDSNYLGFKFYNSNVSIRNSIAANNAAIDTWIYFYQNTYDEFPDYKLDMSNMLFVNNTITHTSWVDTPIYIQNKFHPIQMNNCTIANNTTNRGMTSVFAGADIRNLISYNPGATTELFLMNNLYQIGLTFDVSVSNSLFRGSQINCNYPDRLTTVDNIMGSNPLFLGEIEPGFTIDQPEYYQLSSLSPCIDTGTPDTTGLNLPQMDLAGNYRVWNGRIDMGCYEYGSEPVGIDDPALPSPPDRISISAYPNPLFNTSKAAGVFIEFTLPGKPAAQPVIEIFNVRGQKVKTMRLTESYNSLIHKAGLAGDVKQKGEFYSTVWNGKDDKNRPLASGTYIVKVKADKMVATTKITIIK